MREPVVQARTAQLSGYTGVPKYNLGTRIKADEAKSNLTL
jgi:hypothetical protein